MKTWRVLFLVVTVLCLCAAAAGAASSGSYTWRVSAGSGIEANGASSTPAGDASGYLAVFGSDSSNLVSDDTNAVSDIYAVTRCNTPYNGQWVGRISVSAAGDEANGPSRNPSLASTGDYAAYESDASNLVDNDTNGVTDIFVTAVTHQCYAWYPTTERVSVDSSGVEANGASSYPSISDNGSRVAFQSLATNLVDGDTNGVSDIFVRDLNSNTTVRVSVSSSGEQANGPSYLPVISANGQFVVFISEATNLVEGDTNGVADVFIHDLDSGVTERVNVSTDGDQANAATTERPSVSSDGLFVGFVSGASNLVADDTNGVADVFVRDRDGGTTERVSVGADGVQADGASSGVSIGADGRFVAFSSVADNLVSDDTNGVSDVFVRDRVIGVTVRVSMGSTSEPTAPLAPSSADAASVPPPSSDVEANGPSSEPALCMSNSNTTWYVLFASDATNLVPGDTNGVTDVFARELGSAYVREPTVTNGKITFDGVQPPVPTDCDGTPFYFMQDVEYVVQFVPDPGYQFVSWGCCWSRRSGGVYQEQLTDTVNWLPTEGAGDGDCYGISVDGELIPYSVTIDKTGDGTLTVNDVEVDLPYSATFYYNDPITITAAAGVGHVFSGWSGDESGTDSPLVIAVQSDLNIIAHFPLPNVSLNVDGIGSGSVKVNGTNRALPWNGMFPAGTTVTLEAVPSAGQIFAGWSNGLSGNQNPTQLVLLDDVGVTASFSTTNVTLNVKGDLDAGLKVNGVSQTFPYAGTFPYGTSVALEAFPADCMRFEGWHGAASGMTNPITISMTMNKAITASFSSISAFTDIGCDYWAAREIAACADAGIVTGYPDGTYLPETSIDRAGMATFIARALAGGDASIPSGPATPTFSDVPSDFWAYKYIEYAAGKTIVVGYGDGTYKPTAIVDRGQMSVFIARSMVDPLGDAGLAPYTPPTSPTFPDVTSSNAWAWCYKYVEYLNAQGTVTGYPDGTYKPDVEVSRAQMAVYIARAFDLPL